MEKHHPKTKIIIACHKEVPHVKQGELYMPMHVGKTLNPNIKLDFIGDNSGDNISERNLSFCELTAMYWAWKNLKDVEFIGFCHYRRYFNFSGRRNKDLDYFFSKNEKEDEIEINKFIKNLQKGTVIIPKKIYFSENAFEHYSRDHFEKDIIKTFEVLKRWDTDKKYVQSFVKIMNCNKLSLFNMFIMPWNTFDEYCKFLFSLLFEIENEIDISNYDDYQKRIYGFLGERLLNVFIEANKIKTKEIEVLNIEGSNNHNVFHYTPFCTSNRRYLKRKHKKFPFNE